MSADIRRAEQHDATTVALLGRITFAETFGYLFQVCPGDLRDYLDATFDVAKIERSLGDARNLYWLAFRHRLPIGYAKVKRLSPVPGQPGLRAAQLQKVYVLQAFLARGIGRALLLPAIQAASELASTLWLDVLRENARAVRFYAQHGFVAAGEDTYAIGAQRFLFQIMTRALP
jgi:diamine N-acetyltransferase